MNSSDVKCYWSDGLVKNADPFPLTSLADLADGVTVVPFHSKHAQWVKDRVKLLAMVDTHATDFVNV
jgi:hypothetical protein